MGIAEELQCETCALWGTIGRSRKQRRGACLSGGKGKVEVWLGAALDKSPLEETGSGGFSVADRDSFSLAGTFSLLSKEKIFLLG